MDSKKKRTLLESMESIIVLEARLIDLKRKQQAFDREIKRDMNHIQDILKEEKNNWDCKLKSQKDFSSPSKMDLKDLEKQNQIMTDIEVDNWIEEENEKEIERLEKLAPEERMKEHLGILSILREAEKNNWYCSK